MSDERIYSHAVETSGDNNATRNGKRKLEPRAHAREALPYSDALTGVANRRYVDLKVQQAIQEVELSDRPCGLILIDIDDFKEINDTYGRASGDAALRAICDTLSHCLRPSDVLGRWGGDEFVILARDATPDSLEQLARRCRHVVTETPITAGDSQVKITASVGPILLEKGESCESAFSRADRLLYVNRCVCRSNMR